MAIIVTVPQMLMKILMFIFRWKSTIVRMHVIVLEQEQPFKLWFDVITRTFKRVLQAQQQQRSG